MSDAVTTLPPIDEEPIDDLAEHPLALTDDDIAAGLAAWQAVDDTDDTDNGMPKVGAAPSEAMRQALLVKACMIRHGVPEVSIELLAGRPTSGDDWLALNPIAVFSHHIASTPTVSNPVPGLRLVKAGRPDLPGPLCNGTAGVDLVYRIICLGYANHPGTGGPLTVKGPMGTFTIPRDSARGYAWGTEYEGGYTDAVWDKVYTNKRTGKSMTFREFMGRCNAALVEAIWLINNIPGKVDPAADLSGYHGEHKTWAPNRKPDRRNYSTESGRSEIRKYAHDQEDDMPAEDVWKHRIPIFDAKESGQTREAQVVLAQAHRRSGEARRDALLALRAVGALAKTLAAQQARPAGTSQVGGPEPVAMAAQDVDSIVADIDALVEQAEADLATDDAEDSEQA